MRRSIVQVTEYCCDRHSRSDDTHDRCGDAERVSYPGSLSSCVTGVKKVLSQREVQLAGTAPLCTLSEM